MESRTENIPVKLEDEAVVMVEATLLGGEEDVSSDILPFEQITNAVEAIAKMMARTWASAKSDKTTIELGIEIGIKEGKLIALIVQNSAKANLKITLEWSKSS